MVVERGQAHRAYRRLCTASMRSNPSLRMDVLPPLLTDGTRWRTVVIERSGLASVRFMNDVVVDYLTSVDPGSSTVCFLRTRYDSDRRRVALGWRTTLAT